MQITKGSELIGMISYNISPALNQLHIYFYRKTEKNTSLFSGEKNVAGPRPGMRWKVYKMLLLNKSLNNENINSAYSSAKLLEMVSCHHMLICSFPSHLISRCLQVKKTLLQSDQYKIETQPPHIGKSISLSACIRPTY